MKELPTSLTPSRKDEVHFSLQKSYLVIWPTCLVIPHKEINVTKVNLPLLYASKAESEDYLQDPSSQCEKQPG